MDALGEIKRHLDRLAEKDHAVVSRRLWAALDRALFPDSPSQPDDEDYGRAEKPLIALTGRICAGTETAADRTVLAALPAEDLSEWAGGVCAREFVCAHGKIFSLY